MKKRIVFAAVFALVLTFVMPLFAHGADFVDVEDEQWYTEAVDYVAGKGYFAGTSDDTFDPYTWMSRAMFATVLSRVSYDDLSGYDDGPFSDVAPDAWYSTFVNWAYDKGIVAGTGEATFSPDSPVTREEACVMMSRLLAYKNVDCEQADEITAFSDDASISEWASDAVYQMRRCGVVSGKPENVFDPLGIATRAEVAVMIRKLDQAIISSFDLKSYTVDIRIDGMSGNVRLLQMSDIHLTLTDETDTPEAVANQAARSAGFESEIGDGVAREDRFDKFIDYAKYLSSDLLLLTGDIIDAPSNGNIAFVNDKLNNSGLGYLYILGNHDWTGDWLGTYQSTQQREQNIPKFSQVIGSGEDGVAVRDYGAFVLLAVDNSNDQVTSQQCYILEQYIKNGKPIILALHVPLDAQTLRADVTAK